MFPFKFFRILEPSTSNMCSIQSKDTENLDSFHRDAFEMINIIHTKDLPSDKKYVCMMMKLIPFLPIPQADEKTTLVYLYHIDQRNIIGNMAQSSVLEMNDEIWIADYSQYFILNSVNKIQEETRKNHFKLTGQLLIDLVSKTNLDLLKLYSYRSVTLWIFKQSPTINLSRYNDLLNFFKLYFQISLKLTPLVKSDSILEKIPHKCLSKQQILDRLYFKKEIPICLEAVETLSKMKLSPLLSRVDRAENVNLIFKSFGFQEKTQLSPLQGRQTLLSLALKYPIDQMSGWSSYLEQLFEYYLVRIETKMMVSQRDHSVESLDLQTNDTYDYLFDNKSPKYLSLRSLSMIMAKFLHRYRCLNCNFISLLYAIHQVCLWFRDRTGPLLIMDALGKLINIPFDLENWSLFTNLQDENAMMGLVSTKTYCLCPGELAPEIDLEKKVYYSFHQENQLPLNDCGDSLLFHVIILPNHELISSWLSHLKPEGYFIIKWSEERIVDYPELVKIDYCFDYSKGLDRYLLYQKIT